MRKVLSRVIAVALAIILFSSPSIAQASTIPVLIVDDATNGITVYQYQPTYTLKANSSLTLDNYKAADSYWTVPAGKTFSVDLAFTSGTFRLLIAKVGSGTFYTETITVGPGGYGHTFPASTSDAKYQIWITAYTDVTLDFYGIYLF